MRDPEEIVLRLAGAGACARCGAEAVLAARFPHSWQNGRGEEVPGIREATLCPRCDRGNPAADDLMALFAVDGQVGALNAETFSDLVTAWVESVQQRHVDPVQLTAEHELWQKGEL